MNARIGYTTLVISIFAGLLSWTRPVQAVNVILASDNSNQVAISDLTGFMTTGAAMAGMSVVANFSGGGSESVLWTATGPGSGQAAGTGWILAETGDTFTQTWSLTATAVTHAISIDSLDIDGFGANATGSTVFDRTNPSFGTDGSYRGLDLTIASAAGLWTDVRVTYSNEINSLANSIAGPQGDLYERMNISFGHFVRNADGLFFSLLPFTSGDTFVYGQDTDSVGIRQPTVPGPETPEPSTIVLAGLGGLGLLLQGWRKRRAGRTSAIQAD